MNQEYVYLRDVSELITKGTTPTTLGFDFTDEGIRFLRVQNIEGGQVHFNQETLHIDEKTHHVLKRSQIKPGDVLVSIAGSIGRSAVVPENAPELNCNQAVAIVRTKNDVLQPYLRHWLESFDAQSQMRGSTVTGTISNLSLTQLGSLKVPLPPIAQQKRIAAILDRAEELRGLRRQALGALDAIAQSIFLEMFGDPVTNPKDWTTGGLLDIADFQTGYPFTSADYTTTGEIIKLCRGANVLPNRIDWNDLVSWSKSRIDAVSEFALQADDVVIAMDRPWISEGFKIAQIQQADLPALLVQRVARLRGKNSYSNAFIFQLLKHPIFTRHCKPTETTIPHISPKDIRTFSFPIPPRSFQQEFARRVEAIEQLKTTHRESLAQLDALFASLQHRAFRGEL